MPAFLALLILLAPLARASETSRLWGRDGELWKPESRLPDFSFAGYQSGARPIPSPPARANVRSFGAKGDGRTDDTAAFEKAIAACDNGALLVPAGRYLITRVLYIRKSNFVLRGEGSAKSILLFPKNLLQVLGERKGTGEFDNWSWCGGFLWIEGRETNTKVADVIETAPRGSRTLRLSSTKGLAAGQMIRLMMTDREGSLGRHIHADRMNMNSWLTGRKLVRFPSRIRSIEGNSITLERPLRLDARPLWKPEIHSVKPGVSEVGIEGLGMIFPAQPYPGHYHETGANAIWMDGAWNSWIKDIAIHDCDCGILLERATFCTVDQVRFTASEKRDHVSKRGLHTGAHSGHHGIQQRGGDDCLVSRFIIDTRFHHDLTVENAVGTVFMKGRGRDICFDHHTYIPYENLFTEIDIGEGRRPWLSNGSADPESGARETFWNLRSAAPVTTLATRKGLWPRMNLIGVPTTLRAATDENADSWIEPIPQGALHPSNLYLAQLAKRQRENQAREAGAAPP